MKHTTRLLLAVIDLALGNVISVSGKVHGKPTPAVQVNSASGTTIGSGYWMTNEDSGNCILAADVGSDGQVNLREAYATGGMGLHGINGGNTGPDGLFGQGPVAVSNVTNMLVAVNVLVFIIRSDLESFLLVASGPRRSRSTMNGGEVNGISCFPVHQTSGLTPLADTARYLGINQTTPAAGPTNTVSQILFSSDSSKLLVAYSGTTPTAPGYLGYYDIGVNGSLSKNFSAISFWCFTVLHHISSGPGSVCLCRRGSRAWF